MKLLVALAGAFAFLAACGGAVGVEGERGSASSRPQVQACTYQPWLHLRHEGDSSAIHVVSRDFVPEEGKRLLVLPPLIEGLVVTADGARLHHKLRRDGTRAQTLVSVRIPRGTEVLDVSYRQLDASIPYEGMWYLEHAPVVGPRQIVIDLPPDGDVYRYDGRNLGPSWTHMVFEVPEGQTFSPFVAYKTASVPDLYDRIVTKHFVVSLPSAHRPYRDALLGLLENLYSLYAGYSGQDVNRIQRQARYSYSFPPGRWRWGGVYELGGGLSVKGLSTVNARLMHQLALSPEANNFMVAITAHELANGWWGTWDGEIPENHTPAFINNEGHSGFWRAQAELDLGYCTDAQREHAAHLGDFLGCTNECGGEIVLLSLREKYGWAPFRAFYAGVQSGAFNLMWMSEVERTSEIVRFFSEQVGENLVPFFDARHIALTDAVRADLAARFPAADVPIVTTLTCRPPTLRVAAPLLNIAGYSDEPVAAGTVYACAPGGWRAHLAGHHEDGLSIDHAPTKSCGTVAVQVVQEKAGTGKLGRVVLRGAGQTVRVPLVVKPLGRRNLLIDAGFEDPALAGWQTNEWIGSADFARDDTVARSGEASARIVAPELNDARFVQRVPAEAYKPYLLSGFASTAGVQWGAGANLTIEQPGRFVLSNRLEATQPWTRLLVPFLNVLGPYIDAKACLGNYGAISVGTAWFDDLVLERLDVEDE